MIAITIRSAIALAATTGALALAGCGSGGAGRSAAAASGAPNPQVRADFLHFSECMRAHGLTNFPDPGASGGVNVPIGAAQSPGFRSASNACQKLLPGGGPGKQQLSAAQRRQLLASAQCMRTHGVPNFPDPTFGSAGASAGIKIQATDLNPSSPAFQAAAKACQKLSGMKGRGFSIQAAP
jgi:hypothetical protein